MINNYIQEILINFSDNLRKGIGIVDEGIVYYHGNASQVEQYLDDIELSYTAAGIPFTASGYTFIGSGSRGKPDFLVFIEGQDEEARKLSRLIYVSVFNIKQLYDERYDKQNFIKKIVLDHILPGDIMQKAKELHLQYDAKRVVFVVRASTTDDFTSIDIIRGLFPEKNRDFIIDIDDNDFAFVKEVRADITTEEIEEVANTIVDTINSEAMLKVFVGIGTISNTIRELARSYKEATVALDVGKVFDTEKFIVNYENLGIARLVYQLPTTMCELFLSEVFKKEELDVLDSETIQTIQTFFENNLNVSETSRQLYVHRNTLVYRLDKVQKLTGLDLRLFDHAIVFKVAMMVKKYLNSNTFNV